MATREKINPLVANAIGEIRNIGKPITMIAVDWDVDADASRLAMKQYTTQSYRERLYWPRVLYMTQVQNKTSCLKAISLVQITNQ